MAKDGLTRKEIGWLLAQEARGAARSLRQGFETQLRESVLPPPVLDTKVSRATESAQYLQEISLSAPTLDSLAALDDAMSLLGELHSSREASHHRGRVDVAAMLIELWPDAALNILPGGGTEVFGDTDDIRRMIELLLAQASGPQILHAQDLAVTVSRENDMVQVKVELGPDAGMHSAIESRWLSRLAGRIGGRLATTGRTQILELPADGAAHERELAALRRELSQAQELGEAYARELSEMLTISLKTETDRPKSYDVLASLAEIARKQPEKALSILSATQMPQEGLPREAFLSSLRSNPHVEVSYKSIVNEDAPPSQRGEVITPIQQVALHLSMQFLAQQKNATLRIQHVSSAFGLLCQLEFEGPKEDLLLIGIRTFADEHQLTLKASVTEDGFVSYTLH